MSDDSINGVDPGYLIAGEPAFSTSQIKEILGFGLSVGFIRGTLGIEPDNETPKSELWSYKTVMLITYELWQYVCWINHSQHTQSM